MTPDDIFTTIEEPYWSDQKVYIIGGGSSLKGFDFNKIKDKGILVGCNNSAFSAPCHVCVSMDATWISNERERYRNFKGEVYLSCSSPEYLKAYYEPTARYIKRLHRSADEVQISQDPRYLYGLNTGFGALEIAFLKKAKEIYLLGIDMQVNPQNGDTHWHESYKWHVPTHHKLYSDWANRFDSCRRIFSDEGVKVFNCNPDSKLQAFDKSVTYDDL